MGEMGGNGKREGGGMGGNGEMREDAGGENMWFTQKALQTFAHRGKKLCGPCMESRTLVHRLQ